MAEQATPAEPTSPWIPIGPYIIHEDHLRTGYIKAMGLLGPFLVSISTIITLDSTSKPVDGALMRFFHTLEDAKTFFLKFKEEARSLNVTPNR